MLPPPAGKGGNKALTVNIPSGAKGAKGAVQKVGAVTPPRPADEAAAAFVSPGGESSKHTKKSAASGVTDRSES